MSYPKDAEVSSKFTELEKKLRFYFNGFFTIPTVHNALWEAYTITGLSEVEKWKKSLPSIPSNTVSDPTEKMSFSQFLMDLVRYDRELNRKERKWKKLMKLKKQ